MYNLNRSGNRQYNQLRPIKVTYDSFGYALGNVLFEQGNTKILCSITLQRGVPFFLKGTRSGWLTAQYSLLPSATQMRGQRESVTLKRNNRSIEISRLIGRALRVVVDLNSIGENTIIVDCDVLQADGGTRCACITGSYLALEVAEQRWLQEGFLKKTILREAIAATSVAIVDGKSFLDVDYNEDSNADADFNVVLTSSGRLVELQGTAEKNPVSWKSFDQLRELADHGIKDIFSKCAEYKPSHLIENKKQEKVPLFSLHRRNDSIST